MTTLRDFQQGFAAAVFDETDASIAEHVRANGLSGARRLRVYRNNIYTSLTEALRAVYPVVAKLVGAEFFAHVAEHYIRAHPSRDGNLHAFGARFADFLRAFAGLEAFPYLGDVARLEWSYHEVFHAAMHAPLDIARLGDVDPARYGALHFTLHPAARMIASPYPILKIWEANQDECDDGAIVNLDDGAERLLVIRRDLDIEFEHLDAGAYALLRALHAGATLEDASNAAMAANPDCDIAQQFQHCVLGGVLVDFELNPED